MASSTSGTFPVEARTVPVGISSRESEERRNKRASKESKVKKARRIGHGNEGEVTILLLPSSLLILLAVYGSSE